MKIGLRGHPRTLDWLEPSYEYGYNVVTMSDDRSRGAADVIAQIKDVLAGKPVHITFDLAIAANGEVLKVHVIAASAKDDETFRFPGSPRRNKNMALAHQGSKIGNHRCRLFADALYEFSYASVAHGVMCGTSSGSAILVIGLIQSSVCRTRKGSRNIQAKVN